MRTGFLCRCHLGSELLEECGGVQWAFCGRLFYIEFQVPIETSGHDIFPEVQARGTLSCIVQMLGAQTPLLLV